MKGVTSPGKSQGSRRHTVSTGDGVASRKLPCKGPVWSGLGQALAVGEAQPSGPHRPALQEHGLRALSQPLTPRQAGLKAGATLSKSEKHTKCTANHCKASLGPSPSQPPFQEACLPHRSSPRGHSSHQAHALTSPVRAALEAESDIQREVNHVLFMMSQANITRITSPQISLNSSEMKTMASSPLLVVSGSGRFFLGRPESKAQRAGNSDPVKKAHRWASIMCPPYLGPRACTWPRYQSPNPRAGTMLRDTPKARSVLKTATMATNTATMKALQGLLRWNLMPRETMTTNTMTMKALQGLLRRNLMPRETQGTCVTGDAKPS